MELFRGDGIVPKHEGDVSRHKYFVVLIDPEEYDFLNGKFRYVDCYCIKELPYQRIMDTADFIGTINDSDMVTITELATKSPVNKPVLLKKYGLVKLN